jgi:hypothetical protein
MVELVRHRQTKEFALQPPRHTSTLPRSGIQQGTKRLILYTSTYLRSQSRAAKI